MMSSLSCGSARRDRGRRRAVAAAIGVSLLLMSTGCGSKGASKTATTAAPEATAAAAGGSTVTTGADTTSEPAKVTASAENEPFCTAFLTMITEIGKQATNVDPTDTAAMDSLTAALKTHYATLAGVAPPAIRDDVTAVNGALQKAVTQDEVAAIGTDSTTQPANQRINTWTKDNCGFDPSKVTG